MTFPVFVSYVLRRPCTYFNFDFIANMNKDYDDYDVSGAVSRHALVIRHHEDNDNVDNNALGCISVMTPCPMSH